MVTCVVTHLVTHDSQLAKERPMDVAEIYDNTLKTVREQFRIADANFSARTMDLWLLGVERMLDQAKTDLMMRTINEAPHECG